MNYVIIEIKNKTNDLKYVNLFDLNSGNYDKDEIECSFQMKDIFCAMQGFKISTTSGNKVDCCFYDKVICVNRFDVDVADWFSVSQHTNDFVNILMKIDSIESISFKLNAQKKIELQIPLSKLNLRK